MGKSLIIKGADFSANAIQLQTEWLVDEYDQLISQGGTINAIANPAYSGFAPNFNFGGKTINTIKGFVKAAGKVTLWLGDSLTDASATKVAEFELSSDDVDKVVTKYFDAIDVPAGKYLWLGKSTDTGFFGYDNSNLHPSSLGGFYLLLGTAQARQNTSLTENLALNWGYSE